MNDSIEANPVDLYANLDPSEFIRGETPANIAEKCLELCRAYIGQPWNSVSSPDDIQVTRLTGGLSNQLYRVQLKKSTSSTTAATREFSDVTVKLYQSKIPKCTHPDDGERLNDTIILTILSQVGFGPKVLGIFDGGMIQVYYNHQIVGTQQTQNPAIQRQIAHSLARFHHLKVPIRKETGWQLRQTEQMLLDAHRENTVTELITELNLESFKSANVLSEFSWLVKQIESLAYSPVFSHNDFLGSNMLLIEPDGKLLIIDTEYSTYGCRGTDIAVFMCQYGLEPNEYAKLAMPEDTILKGFIRLYIEECDALITGYASKQENSVDRILKETKLCLMAHFLFWTAFFMYQKENVIKAIPLDIKANYKFAEVYYKKYLNYKATRLWIDSITD